jgi:hypothetical protein
VRRILIYLTLVFFFATPDLSAQRWTLVGTSGLNLYKGDVSDWKFLPSLNQFKVISTALKFNVRYQRRQAFAYRAQISLGRISGAGMNNPGPNVAFNTAAFRSPLVEFSGIMDYNFLDYQTDRKIRNWTPYLYGGVSYLFANPSGGTLPSTTPFFTWAIPYGVGIKYQLSPRFGIQWEFGSSKTFTDVLDNTPSDASNLSHFTIRQTDQVLQSSISITYSIKSVFCPEF